MCVHFAFQVPQVRGQDPARLLRTAGGDGVDQLQVIVKVVGQLLALNAQLQKPQSSQQAEATRRQIASLDQRLDALVFELYEVKPECVSVATQVTYGPPGELLAAT
jgi:hypothetical protein